MAKTLTELLGSMENMKGIMHKMAISDMKHLAQMTILVSGNFDGADMTEYLVEMFGCQVQEAMQDRNELSEFSFFVPLMALDSFLESVDLEDICNRLLALGAYEWQFRIQVPATAQFVE